MSRVPFVQTVADKAPDLLSTLPGSNLAWLDQARREQLQAFVRDGLPGARAEAWKYTALRALARREYALGDAQADQREVGADDLALPGIDGPRLVFVNGVFRADLSTLDALPEGLRLQPLSQSLQDDAEPLRFFLARDWDQGSDAFARLNAALAADGVVIRLDAGCRIQAPVHVVYVGAPAEATLAWHARNIIELGEGASLSLVEHHASSGEQAHLGTLVADVVVRARAELDWFQLQDAAPDAVLMRRHGVRLEADAKVNLHALELGGKLVRHELNAELRGEGANLETRGVFLPSKRQHLDTHLDIRHAACNTSSHALWRGVADQRGRGVFHGQIIVDPGADGTDASLSNKNLLLSPHAEIDTQPVLEIYADEVLAAHGATVGQLEAGALFYLRSRGIPLEQARRLLTAAFCRAALDDVSNQPLLEHLNHLLDAHLPVGGETA